MAWCPDCKGEYVLGIAECPLCHVALVEEEPMEGAEDLNVVIEYDARFADLAKGLLHKHGIECQLEEMTLSLKPFPVPSVAGLAWARVRVKKKHLDEAKRLLTAAEEEHLFCSDCYAFVLPDEEVCPNCGSDLED